MAVIVVARQKTEWVLASLPHDSRFNRTLHRTFCEPVAGLPFNYGKPWPIRQPISRQNLPKTRILAGSPPLGIVPIMAAEAGLMAVFVVGTVWIVPIVTLMRGPVVCRAKLVFPQLATQI